ncbi:hypothetical protein QJQ45_022836, partial [Haematococcus lacustris]
FFIFAVLFVNLLMGTMFSCTDTTDGTEPLDARYLLPDGATLNKTWCLAAAGGVNITSSYYHSRLGVEVPPWSLTTSWSAPFLRFDNVAQAIWTLFQMASLEGWSDVMHQAGDATGPEQQPVRDANIYISLLCILFIVFGSFFIINMIIGVSIDKVGVRRPRAQPGPGRTARPSLPQPRTGAVPLNSCQPFTRLLLQFNRMKQEQGGSILLTEQQKQWLNIQKMLTATQLSKKQAPPMEEWRRPFYTLTITWPGFDQIILAVILLNVAVMCMVHADMSPAWAAAMTATNVAFTAIFILELVLKCTALGVRGYLRVGWNVFDAVVVVASVAGVLLDYCTSAELTFMPLLRVLRIVRIFRLIPNAKGLRTLMQTLLWSLPALGNVGAMLLMFMFMYSVMAMNLFGLIKFQENLTRHANFRTFPMAMITLFRCITGENWNALMQDTMLQDSCVLLMANASVSLPGADQALQLAAGTYLDKQADADTLSQLPVDAVRSEAPDGCWVQEDQCSLLPALSILFFISFMLLCSYLLLQLIIAVVLDSIQLQYNQETLVIQQDHMWAFVETWEKLDEYGDGFIDVWELTTLLSAVPPPLGVKGMDQIPFRVQQMVLDVNIPIRECRVHFLECLHAFAGRVAGAELPQEEEYRVHDKLVQRLPQSSQPPKYNAGHYYSAQYIKSAVKGFLVRLQLEPLWAAAEEREAAARQSAAQGLDLPPSARLSQAGVEVEGQLAKSFIQQRLAALRLSTRFSQPGNEPGGGQGERGEQQGLAQRLGSLRQALRGAGLKEAALDSKEAAGQATPTAGKLSQRPGLPPLRRGGLAGPDAAAEQGQLAGMIGGGYMLHYSQPSKHIPASVSVPYCSCYWGAHGGLCTATSSIREQPEFAMTLQNNNENLHDFMLSRCAPLFVHLALKYVTKSPEPLEGEGGLAA